ncbi:FI18312p1 [Strongyloides ratti]|uniref:protein-tyrosine-phosphatase n=1 Tax=Strongyloides ratti TaxID=34506 RepID=A0A090N0M7_STRRB|nr:FI18312p1 [Strongyloides ratti]CEF70958.1 FI18312p1 [Strongyloides ratti]
MAPDFESPQLIRRLDWYHEDLLIASYQQIALVDLNKQWWVGGMRYELIKPFYELRIQPTLPEDSGNYKCRLEADPLFVKNEMTFIIPIIVMVRPPAPSKPFVTNYSDKNVTLSWNHSVAKAHIPILKYSILVSQVDVDDIQVILTKSNETRITINKLLPYTKYAFSVRAENAAGHSNFGEETIFRTMGEPPKNPPIIVSITNETNRCVNVKWLKPNLSTGEIVGYRIMLHRLGSGDMREWYFKTTSNSLCSLAYHQDYRLSIEADNGFGYSPSVTQLFRTDIGIPDTPPEPISAITLSSNTIRLSWKEPNKPNGPIIAFHVYFYPIHLQKNAVLLKLNVAHEDHTKIYNYNITKLQPNTTYLFRLTAVTEKGESEKSIAIEGTTDYIIPYSPTITNITTDCLKESVKVSWTSVGGQLLYYTVYLQVVKNSYKITQNDKSTFQNFNSTVTSMIIEGLTLNVEYLIKVTAFTKNINKNGMILESDPSKTEIFMLKKKCDLYHSLCMSKNDGCKPLENANHEKREALMPSSNTSFILIIILTIFGSILLIGIYLYKQHCISIKNYSKKSTNCSNQETTALVYDENCYETVPVGLFEKYCQTLASNNNALYIEQFENLSVENDKLEVEGTDVCQEVQQKNRYLNIGAYESTRIKLNGNGTSDYINANYIDSCDKRKAYIATQAPLPNTFSDFWSMIWQEKCNVIVCITKMIEKGRRKCDQYWPSEIKRQENIGNFTIVMINEIINGYFTHRILTLKSNKCHSPERIIHHLQFTAWPDHGVPDNVFPLLSFMNYVSTFESNEPLVVHCSAGVGRSGSYILIDSIRKHLTKNENIKIYSHLQHMRRQRGKLVQTIEQYIFCHEAIKSLIKYGITRIPTKQFTNFIQYLLETTQTGKTALQLQYEDLCKCNHLIPCYFPIGCTTLPGYHRSDEFIIANYPAETYQLWDSVYDSSCQTICCLMAHDDFTKFWSISPNVSSYYSEDSGITRFVTKKIENNSIFIRTNESEDELVIRVIQIDPDEFKNDVWNTIESVQIQLLQYHNNNTMILVPEYSNIKTAFKYCILTSIGCQIEHEQHVDVLQYLSSYHNIRCNCWSKQSDVEFIYDKTLELIQLQKN